MYSILSEIKMLYCQPEQFYNEMKLMGDNHNDFPKRITLAEYNIPETVQAVDPVSYLIKMWHTEPFNIQSDDDYIFGLRTFGIYNLLEPNKSTSTMQVYYAKAYGGSLWISKPVSSAISMKDGELYFETTDEFGDQYEFTFDEILKEKHNPYAVYSYTTFSENVFRPENLMAKIPTNLLYHLV